MTKRSFLIILQIVMTVMLMANGKRVLFIGDSITDGAWGNSNVWNATSDQRDQNDMNHIYGHGYMMIVASRFQTLYPEEEWQFWNRGISGNTLDDLAGRWQKDVLDLSPDVVSILIGTNDVEQALNDGTAIDTESWGNKLRMLLDETLKSNPETQFVLCTPFVAKAGWRGDSENYGKRHQMITELVKVTEKISNDYHATLVPFDTLVNEAISSTPNRPVSYWIWDGIHPTPAMHYRMAEMWIEKTDMNAQVKSLDPVIVNALAQVSEDSIENHINDLVSFHTRHNLSTQTDPKIGLGAAVLYLEKRCKEWAAEAGNKQIGGEIHRYDVGGENTRLGRLVNLPELMVTIPGTNPEYEIIMMAHVDTRFNDNNDGTTFAPGANDDGSGVACLMEAVRILSKLQLRHTVKCLFVSGEEHGLFGAASFADRAEKEHWPILGVLNNDMIGNAEASETGLTTDRVVRVFSESKQGEDSDARQWARYIKEMGETYVPGHEVKLIYRNDRYGRGGDHTPFLRKGFRAVRMSEYFENYDRTHQVVREENGIKYGDVLSGVCLPYVARNTRVNLASVMNLAQAPLAPTNAKIANAAALSNYTILSWDPVLTKEGTTDKSVTYEILYRETDQSTWKIYQTCKTESDGTQTVKMPISKDNYFFAVRSIDSAGHPSLPMVCR